MLTLLVTAYATVLVAELVGDKTLYTLGTLATRFSLPPVLAGAALAFMLKMLAAVLLGHVLTTLPAIVVIALSALTFFGMAVGLWFKKPGEPPAAVEAPRWSRATLIAFAVIFFPEWGDPGQLAAAILAAEHQAPLVIWLGGTLAMATKACLAVTLGIGLRRWVPRNVMRITTVAVCTVMGLLAVFHLEF